MKTILNAFLLMRAAAGALMLAYVFRLSAVLLPMLIGGVYYLINH